MPSELALEQIVTIDKKGSKDDRKNYRDICLLSYAFKIFSVCLLQRVLPVTEPLLPETQAGFRQTRGCRDKTCLQAWIIYWLLDNGRTAKITYINFKEAFHVSTLRSSAYPEKCVRLVPLMYEPAKITVRAEHQSGTQVFSRKVHIERDVLQGGILSHLCFIIALDRIFRRHNQLGFV